LGVLVAVGVAARLVGVLALAVAACCLEDRPPAEFCFRVAGEFDRVDVGLVGLDGPVFFLHTGRRDVGDFGEVGDVGM